MKQAKQIIGYWCQEILEGNALGDGICVAVLDTELCAYPDLKSRVLEFQDFVGQKRHCMMIVDMERMLRESWLEIVTFQGDTVGVVYAKAISYPSC